MSGLIIDLFAGGGGASMGIYMATGRHPDVAVNHDPKAIAMHKANHPHTMHVCQDVWTCPPRWACKGRPVALLHASPDCTHFSKAKGSAPRRDQKRRDLAWVIVKWAQEVRPLVITMENVEEFTGWGPLDREGRPIASQAGQTFRAFINALRRLGYAVQWRELRACDFGAPTIRKRLFLIARCDGRRIKWPRPIYGDPKSLAVKSGKLKPYRTAAECIDWSIPCPSIFDRKRPLAENTLKRIAEGIRRYVLNAAQPFIVTYYGPKKPGDFRGCGMDDLLGTQTTENRHALVTPFLTEHANASTQRNFNIEEPLRTQCAQVKGGHFAMVSPVLVTNTTGHAPSGVDEPVATLTTGQHQMAVSAFLAKHYGGVVGHELERPIGSVTTVDHHSLVAASMVKMRGSNVGSPAGDPLHTISAQGQHHGVVAAHIQRDFGNSVGQAADGPLGTVTAGGGGKAGLVYSFLTKYYGQGVGQAMSDPAATVTTKDRMGLITVTIKGQPYVIADIGMRMLQPRELYRAQGFPPSYIIGDDPAQGLSLTKAEQVRMCGNSVSPPVAAAVMDANVDIGFVPQRGPQALPLLAGEGRA